MTNSDIEIWSVAGLNEVCRVEVGQRAAVLSLFYALAKEQQMEDRCGC